MNKFVNAVIVGSLFVLFIYPLSGITEESTVLIREDIRTFSQDSKKVKKLRDAVRILKNDRKFSEIASWLNMAAIHAIQNPGDPLITSDIPEENRKSWGQCHNRDSSGDEPEFFIWHRAYVYAMEKLMQDAIKDPSFRLPYWDWYSDATLPEIFRIPADENTNSLYVKDRKSNANDGLVVEDNFNFGFSETNFNNFQTNLNYGDHGFIHMGIGTRNNLMGNPMTAARDPIFWVHHANIDRLLVVWEKLNPGVNRANELYPNWSDKKYRFPKVNGGYFTPTVSELALNSDKALGYTYENTSASAIPKSKLPVAPTKILDGTNQGLSPMQQNVQSISTTKNKVEIGDGLTVSLPLQNSVGNKLNKMANGTTQNGDYTSIRILLNNIALTENVSEDVIGYRVYLNLPSQESKNSFEDYFLGSISLFSLSHHVSHEHMSHNNLSFEVIDKIKVQLKSLKISPSELRVSIIPVYAPNAKGPTSPVITIDEIKVEASTFPVM